MHKFHYLLGALLDIYSLDNFKPVKRAIKHYDLLGVSSSKYLVR